MAMSGTERSNDRVVLVLVLGETHQTMGREDEDEGRGRWTRDEDEDDVNPKETTHGRIKDFRNDFPACRPVAR